MNDKIKCIIMIAFECAIFVFALIAAAVLPSSDLYADEDDFKVICDGDAQEELCAFQRGERVALSFNVIVCALCLLCVAAFLVLMFTQKLTKVANHGTKVVNAFCVILQLIALIIVPTQFYETTQHTLTFFDYDDLDAYMKTFWSFTFIGMVFNCGAIVCNFLLNF